MSSDEPLLEITIRTEFNRPALLALRDQLDELLEGLDAPFSSADSPREKAARLARETVKANSSWERLSGNTRQYLAACARIAKDDETFTIDDVADAMGLSHATVLALHRNVMRTSATAEPPTTPLITSRRTGGRTELSMSKPVSIRLLQLADPEGE
jgi:hypothetical protein